MDASGQATLMRIYKNAIKIGIMAGILLLIIIFSGSLLPVSIRNSMDILFLLVPGLIAMAIGILAIKDSRGVLPGLIDAAIISGLAGSVAGFIMGVIFTVVDIISNQADIPLSIFIGLIITIMYTIILGIIAAIFGILYTIIVFRIVKNGS